MRLPWTVCENGELETPDAPRSRRPRSSGRRVPPVSAAGRRRIALLTETAGRRPAGDSSAAGRRGLRRARLQQRDGLTTAGAIASDASRKEVKAGRVPAVLAHMSDELTSRHRGVSPWEWWGRHTLYARGHPLPCLVLLSSAGPSLDGSTATRGARDAGAALDAGLLISPGSQAVRPSQGVG